MLINHNCEYIQITLFVVIDDINYDWFVDNQLCFQIISNIVNNVDFIPFLIKTRHSNSTRARLADEGSLISIQI